MNHIDALAAKAIENPAILSSLTKDEIRQVLTKLLTVTGAVAVAWLAESDADHVEKLRASGDRLLDAKEMAARIGCSVATIQRGWKRGRYPFMLKDGGRLVGSEDGLGRWIANRIKRSAYSSSINRSYDYASNTSIYWTTGTILHDDARENKKSPDPKD